ncbi:MAG: insulinase family protein [Rhodothermales bacterium]
MLRRLFALSTLLLAFVPLAVAQDTAAPLPETSAIPLDPLVRTGTLPNGLTYYIRQNSRPENRAELRLAVNAGSILEDDDQQGLAHFLEHMAFNGTEKFEKQALVNYLESIGTRFGPDLNAYTSFDETVYMLQVRTDSMAQFTTGIEVLREWSSNVVLDEEEIDKERGVVIEEWRLGRGAFARIREAQFPVLLKGSRYAERLPIGQKEVLESFDYDTVRRYYHDWYRPDLMAIVAVGDFDVDAVEAMIVEQFSTLENPEDAKERPTFSVPGNIEPLVTIATDPELPYGSVQVVYKHPKEDRSTLAGYRKDLTETLYSVMFNQRLQELTQSADPPFTFASAGPGTFVKGADFYNLQAVLAGGGHLNALEVLLTEAERVRQHGFTQAELDRAKTDLLRSFEKAYAERDKGESRSYASRYVNHYLEADPTPGIEYSYRVSQDLIPAITIEEVNYLVTQYLTDENRVILADGNDPEAMPTEEQLLSAFQTVATKTIEPYAEEVVDAPLLPEMPTPGAVRAYNHNMEVGVTRATLSNGIQVVLKETDFKNDEIVFSAYSPGGTSLVDDADYIPASFGSSLVGQSGVGAFGPIELGKKLTGKLVNVRPTIGSRSEGFTGSSTPEDVETLFQLVHLYFTAPRADEVAYASFKKRIGQFMLGMKADPSSAFRDTMTVTMSQDHPRAQPFSQATLDAMDLDASFAFYKERFADADDFTFYFVGNFDTQRMLDLSAQYLGSLPTMERRYDTPRDVGIRAPEGVITKVVQRGVEPQAQVRIVFTGDADWSQNNQRLMSAMTQAFQIKLREVLREDLGGVYGVGVSGSLSREPVERYSISVSFGCDPERINELVSTIYAEINSAKDGVLDDTYVTKVRETILRGHETNLKENRYWLSTLSSFDRTGLDVSTIPTGLPTFMETITSVMLEDAAEQYFTFDNVATFLLVPEAFDASTLRVEPR